MAISATAIESTISAPASKEVQHSNVRSNGEDEAGTESTNVPWDALPAGVLLRIFSHLPASQLLSTVRATCHTWRQLALRPEAWQGVEVSLYQARDVALCFRVLRLAPCLHSLHLHLPAMPTYLKELACTTSCTVERLTLSLGQAQVHDAIRVIHNQSKNHVRHLRLALVAVAATDLVKLLETVVSDLPELEGLSVSLEAAPSEPLGAVHLGKGSLKYLQLDGETERIAELLVRANSTTLRSLVLACPLHRPLAVSLQECVELDSLSLKAFWVLWSRELSGEERQELVDCFQLFARRIRSLHIDFPNLGEFPSDDPVVVDLLQTLEGSSLKRLHMNSLPLCQVDHSMRLVGALCGLPRLTALHLSHLSGAGVELLMNALAERYVTNLRLLEITDCPSSNETPTLRRLLQRNPDLHVIGPLVVDGKDCSSCKKDGPAFIGVFAHAQTEMCSICLQQNALIGHWHWMGGADRSARPRAEIAQPPTNEPWGQKTLDATKPVGIGESNVQKPSFWCCCAD